VLHVLCGVRKIADGRRACLRTPRQSSALFLEQTRHGPARLSADVQSRGGCCGSLPPSDHKVPSASQTRRTVFEGSGPPRGTCRGSTPCEAAWLRVRHRACSSWWPGDQSTADILSVVAGTAVDLGPNSLAVRLQGLVEIGFVVVSGNHHVAALAPFWVESVVVEGPSRDRVVFRIDFGHPAHLPLARYSPLQTSASSITQNPRWTKRPQQDRMSGRRRSRFSCGRTRLTA
jgi:hypothetical protein